MKLFIDDVRKAPQGWIPVFTANDALTILQHCSSGEIEQISFDHDLGTEKTGYDVMLYVESRAHKDLTYIPPFCSVHSANLGARKKMEQCANKINALYVMRKNTLTNARKDDRIE